MKLSRDSSKRESNIRPSKKTRTIRKGKRKCIFLISGVSGAHLRGFKSAISSTMHVTSHYQSTRHRMHLEFYTDCISAHLRHSRDVWYNQPSFANPTKTVFLSNLRRMCSFLNYLPDQHGGTPSFVLDVRGLGLYTQLLVTTDQVRLFG